MHMSKIDNIFIIGPMGVGKTTIGKRLARRLDKNFFDSDKEIEKKTGATISLIFDVEGEPGFRERETRTLDELTSRQGVVVATGGGAVLSDINRQRLSARGLVIYLSGSPELLMKRTSHDSSRPLLETGDRLGKIRTLLAEREPLYSQIADSTINVDKMTAKDIVNQIERYLNQLCEK